MKSEALRSEIRTVFPSVDMPPSSELACHPVDCIRCEYLADDLEPFRGKAVDAEILRVLHQDLSCLSARGWRWILPHYLSYALTSDAEDTQSETEFLLYNLAPDEQFQPETRASLSLLSATQLVCIIHWLDWLAEQSFWNGYFGDEINAATQFISTLAAERSMSGQ